MLIPAVFSAFIVSCASGPGTPQKAEVHGRSKAQALQQLPGGAGCLPRLQADRQQHLLDQRSTAKELGSPRNIRHRHLS